MWKEITVKLNKVGKDSFSNYRERVFILKL